MSVVIREADRPIGMSVKDYEYLSNDCLNKIKKLGIHNPVTQKSLKLVLIHASSTVMERFYSMARDMGLLPPVYGYLDDGTHIFNAEQIAEYSGFPLETVNQLVEIFQIRQELQGLDAVTPDQINRAQ